MLRKLFYTRMGVVIEITKKKKRFFLTFYLISPVFTMSSLSNNVPQKAVTDVNSMSVSGERIDVIQLLLRLWLNAGASSDLCHGGEGGINIYVQEI